MKRIRYKKLENGMLESEMIDTPDGAVRIQLDTVQVKGTLIGGEANGIIVLEAPSMQMLKLKVKKALIELGASFETERRVRADNQDVE